MAHRFPSLHRDEEPPDPSPAEYANFVSLAVVGHDPDDPTLAHVRVQDGQVLVEVTLSDGDCCDAWLCHHQTGASAGDYIPVEPGDSVVLVWPDGDSSPYIVARLADVERSLAGSACGIDTTGPVGIRQFRWMRTPDGQIYAVQSGGELLLEGGGGGVRITGEQLLMNGATHLGADFVTPPVPGEVLGQKTTPSVPPGPFIPEPAASPSLSDPPPGPQLLNGIVRFRDAVEANLFTDTDFFGFVNSINAFIILAANLLGLPWEYDTPDKIPIKITAAHVTASTTHTANDKPPVP